MPDERAMCAACWRVYEGRTGGVDDGKTLDSCLDYSFGRFSLTGSLISFVKGETSRNLRRCWDDREGKDYQAELERLVGEYRQEPPDYTQPDQAVRLMELAEAKHGKVYLNYASGWAEPYTIQFYMRGSAVGGKTFGAAVLRAAYNAIPEEFRER